LALAVLQKGLVFFTSYLTGITGVYHYAYLVL
jgi:hypothetical protein